ncbi:MAG: TauD/TfdA family dioxygenase [Alphaproteobacteria bacterium]|nr:TauD/TfdA family dioxygenase [Alphaproteobacteria bacterium]
MPLKTIEGSVAWRGDDIKSADDFTHRLTDAEIAELDAAVQSVMRAGIDHVAIDRNNFSLPSLGKRLIAIRDDVLLAGRGFMVIRGVPVARYSIEEAAAAYLGIGAYFGKAVSQNGKGHILGHVKDLGRRFDDPNARIYQTTHRQTFHTDSADIVALLCLKTAKAGGLSRIVSSIFLYNEMFRRRPDLAAVLFEPFCFDRRGEVPAGKKGYYETPIFHWHAGQLSIIYGNRYYIDSAQRFPDAPRLTQKQIEALDLFDALANDPSNYLDIEFMPGDIQLLHNHVILHDRTDYEDWLEPERKRHLLRLWLCPPNGRPLPAVFADRYGGTEIGNRGGIVLPGARMVAPMEAV